MKIAVIIARILFGGMFIFASVVYFLKVDMGPMPKMSEGAMKFNEGIMASGYLMQLVKTVELICGLAILTGLFLPLAVVLIFPIMVNIFCFHAFLDPGKMPLIATLMVLNLFLAWACRKNYAGLFERNRIA